MTLWSLHRFVAASLRRSVGRSQFPSHSPHSLSVGRGQWSPPTNQPTNQLTKLTKLTKVRQSINQRSRRSRSTKSSSLLCCCCRCVVVSLCRCVVVSLCRSFVRSFFRSFAIVRSLCGQVLWAVFVSMKINGEVCLPISVVCTGCLSSCWSVRWFPSGFGFMVSVFLGSMLVDFGLHLGCWLAGSTS